MATQHTPHPCENDNAPCEWERMYNHVARQRAALKTLNAGLVTALRLARNTLNAKGGCTARECATATAVADAALAKATL